MSFSRLQELNYRIATPLSEYSSYSPPLEVKQVIYNGLPLPRFLLDNGCDPSQMREFLRLNRIGSAFDELYNGRIVMLPAKDSKRFSKHPEA